MVLPMNTYPKPHLTLDQLQSMKKEVVSALLTLAELVDTINQSIRKIEQIRIRGEGGK